MTICERPHTTVKDPISTLTHFIGFISAIFLSLILVARSAFKGNLISTIAIIIYSASLIILYGASSAYHFFNLSYYGNTRLKKFDHIAVFYLIAGSYTPICSVIDSTESKLVLILVWIFALLGTILKLCWVYCPKYVSSIVYIAMGWLALIRIRSFYLALGTNGFILLLSGGILYTIGGIIYAQKIRFNENWGEHELFHIFVLLGSLLHYLMIFLYIA